MENIVLILVQSAIRLFSVVLFLPWRGLCQYGSGSAMFPLMWWFRMVLRFRVCYGCGGGACHVWSRHWSFLGSTPFRRQYPWTVLVSHVVRFAGRYRWFRHHVFWKLYQLQMQFYADLNHSSELHVRPPVRHERRNGWDSLYTGWRWYRQSPRSWCLSGTQPDIRRRWILLFRPQNLSCLMKMHVRWCGRPFG